MTKKKVWRYYCDHCKKGSCGAASMIRHEARCIRNPLRVCGMCNHIEGKKAPLAELVQIARRFRSEPEDFVMGELREKALGCPVCILSAIIQARGRNPDPEDDFYVNFRYKDEVKNFWDIKNDAELAF